jgi:hypothetical protein
MNKYHFSAKFNGLDFTYHGEFTTAHTATPEIVKLAKVKLLSKMKVWNLLDYQSKLIYFKIYTYVGEEEREVFLYEQ